MRGRSRYRRRRADRAVGVQALRSGPARGPSRQLVSKSRACQDADADTDCHPDDAAADRFADWRTDTFALALSQFAEPLASCSLSPPGS